MFARQFTRSLATATKATGVKPPVQLFGIDGTYATALFTAASKDSSIEKAQSSIESIAKTVSTDIPVQTALSNPALSLSTRLSVVDSLSKTLKLDPVVINLLKVLAENNRLSLIESIAKQFGKLSDAYKGVVEATVVSTKPLDSKVLSRLSKSISASKYVGSGKTLKITNEVNPDILGGLIVEVADRTVDLSVASKVQKLNKVLTESI